MDRDNKKNNSLVLNLKDKITSLSVDLDDKTKLCTVIIQKIESGKQNLRDVEDIVSNEFSPKLEAEVLSQRQAVEEAIVKTSQLVEKKKEMLRECETLIESISQKEIEQESVLRKIYAEGELVLEQDRKSFKSTSDERLQKRLQQRLIELKEKTARALEPEIQRLKSLHEREMKALEIHHEKRIAELKSESVDRLERKWAIVEREMRQSFQARMTNLEDEHNRSCQALEAQHLMTVKALTQEAEANQSRAKSTFLRKLESLRSEHQQQLIDLQRHSSQRLEKLKNHHDNELGGMERSYEAQRQEILKSLDEAKELIRNNLQKKYLDDYSKKTNLTQSPTRSKSTSASQDAVDDTEHSELLRRRDEVIQNEIKSLQLESIRLERQWTSDTANRIKEIESTSRYEQETLKKEIQSVSEQITQLIVENKNLSANIATKQLQLEETSNELKQLRQEEKHLKDKIASTKTALQESKAIHLQRQKNERELFESDLQSLQDRFKSLSTELESLRSSHQRNMESMDDQFHGELEAMDVDVKAKLKSLDDQIAAVKESISEETIVVKRLKELVLKYERKNSH